MYEPESVDSSLSVVVGDKLPDPVEFLDPVVFLDTERVDGVSALTATSTPWGKLMAEQPPLAE